MSTPDADSISIPVKSLKLEQPIIEKSFFWNEQVIIEIDWRSQDKMKKALLFWYLDEANDLIRPLSITAKDETLIKLSENLSRNLLLTRKAGKYKVHELVNGQDILLASDIVLSDEVSGLTANKDRVYIVGYGTAIEIGKRQRKIGFYAGLSGNEWIGYRFVGATENALLLASDRGEWGGELHSVNLGLPMSRKAQLLIEGNIESLQQTKTGAWWVASRGRLYKLIDQGKNGFAKFVLEEQQAEIKQGKFKTTFRAMTISDNNDIFLAADYQGLFKFREGITTNLWGGPVAIWYDMPSRGVGSFPQNILVREKRIYVASRSLGILIFEEKKENSYEFVKQAVFSDK